MKKEYIIGAIVIVVLAVGGYFYMKSSKNIVKTPVIKNTNSAATEEKVTIPTQNVKVSMPKAQNTKLDTTQLENEMNNLDVEGNSDLDVDFQ